MDQEIAAIHLYLSTKSLHVSKDWLEGCVYFFRSENSMGYGRAQLEEFVFEQWKLVDLREMSEACLPQNLSAKMNITLPGKYSLQVESMVDIGAPCYSQLQKIRKVATENLEVSETKAQTWEPRPTRMFKLMLCDGVQEIMGIEYRPIRKLDQILVPGCKVVVIGPVVCRKGVLLLKEHNLQIIGGEVDTMLIPNALENLLARTLNLEENPQPYLNGLTPPEVSTPAQVIVQPTAANTVQPATNSAIVQPHVKSTLFQPPTNNAIVNTVRPVAQVAPMAVNEFNEDDILQCAELDEIERRFQQEFDDIPDDMIVDDEVNFPDSVSSRWNGCSNKTATSGQVSNTRLPTANYNRDSNSRQLGQLQHNSLEGSANNLFVSSKGNNVISQAVNKINAKINDSNYQKPCLPVADNNSVMKFKTNSFSDLDDFEESQFSRKTCSSTVNTGVCVVDLLEQDDELLLDISSQDLDASILPAQDMPTKKHDNRTVSSNKLTVKQETVNLCKKPARRNQSKITSFISKNQTGINSFSWAKGTTKKSVLPPIAVKRPPSSPLKNMIPAPRQKIFVEQKNHKPLEMSTISTLEPEKQGKKFNLTSNYHNVQTSSKLCSKVNGSVKECVLDEGTEKSVSNNDTSENLCSRVPLPVMEHRPFVYLNQLESLPRTCVATFTVKAFVLTLVSQLVLKEGWHLLCKINDGSTVMQVAFSSDVLEKLIGYTPAEMRVLRQQMATNPSIKEKLKGALLDAQKKLVNLNCLLNLTFQTDSDVPVVTAISEVGKEHVELLNRRLLTLNSVLQSHKPTKV